MERVELFNDHFQNFKVYGIPHAQLIIADPPYNLGKNAYASNPQWYKGGDLKNGESELANAQFFDTDKTFTFGLFLTSSGKSIVSKTTISLIGEAVNLSIAGPLNTPCVQQA